MNLENYRNEIYKKIGKNILLFQKIESILKYITIFKKTASHGSQFQEKYKILSDDMKNKTMGQLLNEYLNSEKDKSNHDVDVSKEPFVSFHLELSSKYIEKKSKILRELLSERNDLVHHSYLNFDIDSIENCIEIIKLLDEQKERINLELQDLVSIVEKIESFKKNLIHTLNSDKFKIQLVKSLKN